MNRPIIWLATTNDFKLSEYKKLLPKYNIKSIADLPKSYYETSEAGTTFLENALLKAKDLANFIGGLAIGDDSGIEVAALDNFPGVYSKRWALPETNWLKINLKLLDLVASSKDSDNRAATMITAIAFYDAKSGRRRTFESRVKGHLADTPEFEGETAFGYDPIFIPNGYKVPYAKISIEEKNKTSPRALATNKLLAFLEGAKQK